MAKTSDATTRNDGGNDDGQALAGQATKRIGQMSDTELDQELAEAGDESGCEDGLADEDASVGGGARTMTDETRDEIVRLAKKGDSAWTIATKLNAEARVDDRPGGWVTEEQVRQVVAEAEDAIGRVAKWLQEAVEAGVRWQDIAQALADAAWLVWNPGMGDPTPDNGREAEEALALRLDESAEESQAEETGGEDERDDTDCGPGPGPGPVR